MKKVFDGMFVKVDYTGTLNNGDVFDTSQGRQPLEVKMGAGQLISGFENELLGMSLNEKKAFTLNPENAYGYRDENLTQDFPQANIPPEMTPELGMVIGLHTPQGEQVPGKIVHMDDKKITVDLNHPLAGESLTFEIEVKGISETPSEASGSHGCGGVCSEGHC